MLLSAIGLLRTPAPEAIYYGAHAKESKDMSVMVEVQAL